MLQAHSVVKIAWFSSLRIRLQTRMRKVGRRHQSRKKAFKLRSPLKKRQNWALPKDHTLRVQKALSKRVGIFLSRQAQKVEMRWKMTSSNSHHLEELNRSLTFLSPSKILSSPSKLMMNLLLTSWQRSKCQHLLITNQKELQHILKRSSEAQTRLYPRASIGSTRISWIANGIRQTTWPLTSKKNLSESRKRKMLASLSLMAAFYLTNQARL